MGPATPRTLSRARNIESKTAQAVLRHKSDDRSNSRSRSGPAVYHGAKQGYNQPALRRFLSRCKVCSADVPKESKHEGGFLQTVVVPGSQAGFMAALGSVLPDRVCWVP